MGQLTFRKYQLVTTLSSYKVTGYVMKRGMDCQYQRAKGLINLAGPSSPSRQLRWTSILEQYETENYKGNKFTSRKMKVFFPLMSFLSLLVTRQETIVGKSYFKIFINQTKIKSSKECGSSIAHFFQNSQALHIILILKSINTLLTCV